MFRQPIARLRQSALPVFKRGASRSRTTGPSQTTKAGSAHSQKAFWTTGRVLLLSAFTGSATYLYGINDASKLQLPWMKATGPQYATKTEMEKACSWFERQLYDFTNNAQAIDELRAAFGEDTISTDDEDLHRHGYSEWSSINIDQLPVAVAYPKSTEEVSQLAQVCHKYKIPMSMAKHQARSTRADIS